MAPGSYAVCARISDGTRTRYQYLGERLVITPPPGIDPQSLAWIGGSTLRFNVHASPGQTVAVLASTDLLVWATLETHTFTGTVWEFTDADAGTLSKRFYKAALVP